MIDRAARVLREKELLWSFDLCKMHEMKKKPSRINIGRPSALMNRTAAIDLHAAKIQPLLCVLRCSSGVLGVSRRKIQPRAAEFVDAITLCKRSFDQNVDVDDHSTPLRSGLMLS